MKHQDKIEIRGLKVVSHVGVPAAEREKPQELRLNLVIRPTKPLRGLSDQIEQTIDYQAVAAAVRERAGKGSRKLIETLAEEIGELVMELPGVGAVEVEVRKFVLPETDWVSVSLSMDRRI